MSILKINKNVETNGSFSFSAVLDETVKPPMLRYNGILQMDIYEEDLKSIENERYIIEGIHVTSEQFGSEEDSYGYTFTFKKFKDKRKQG